MIRYGHTRLYLVRSESLRRQLSRAASESAVSFVREVRGGAWCSDYFHTEAVDFAPDLKAGRVICCRRYFRNKTGKVYRAGRTRYYVAGRLNHPHYLQPLDLSKLGWHEVRPEPDESGLA